MRISLSALALLPFVVASHASAEEGEGAEEVTADIEDGGEPEVDALGTRLEVAWAGGDVGLEPGAQLAVGDTIEVDGGGCVRLWAAPGAAVVVTGPARLAVVAAAGRPEAVGLEVLRGRGVMTATGAAAAIRVVGRRLVVRGGAVAFDASGEGRLWRLSGEVRLDGRPLEGEAPAPPELRRAGLCSPPRPVIEVSLGEPAAVVASLEQRQATEAEEDSATATAEGGATCVDSADSSAASDPTQGGEGGVDPDARRDNGRVRVLIHLPSRQ